MGLSGALQIGRSGLLANQAAIEVAGNNLANMATRGYHRQVLHLTAARTQELQTGIFIGRGVQVEQITRAVDNALEARIRGGIADQSASLARQELLTQIEAIQNELSDIDLSSQLSQFFNAFSDLANQPLDNSLRALLTQQGASLASFIRNLRTDLVSVRDEADRQINQAAVAANDLLERIESINQQIAKIEGGTGGAHSLRDERDQLLAELSEYLDISIIEQNSGAVDVFVGSLPVILNGYNRGIEVRKQVMDGELKVEVVLADDGSPLDATSGRIGALAESREGDVQAAIDTLDEFANQLIFQVNRLHSQGQGLGGVASVTATNRVLDTAVAINDALAGLDFTPTHGSFQLHLTQKSTGQRTTSAINIDLDGIGADTTLADLAAAINGVANVTATITPDGRLQIDSAGSDYELSFSDDSSGVLATLGINTFFTGGNAQDIEVHAQVLADPSRVAASLGHLPGDNSNALAIAGLRTQGLDALSGMSLTEAWNRHIEDYAIRLGQTNSQVEADSIVRDGLEAQQQSVSGVNPDEEAINLLAFQRAYQGSARFLMIVDEMMETLLALV